jgi:hypothetical protein
MSTNSMLRFVPTLSVLLSCACNAGEPTSIELADREVYAAILSHPDVIGYNGPGLPVEYLVVASTTTTRNFGWLYLIATSEREAPDWYVQADVDRNLVSQFVGKSMRSTPLEQLRANIPVRVIDADIPQLFHAKGKANSWPFFWELYPNSTGLITVTRVAYNESGTEALVYIHSMRAGLSAGGHLVGVQKVHGEWIVAWTELVDVS